MRKWKCQVCGYVYDPLAGDPTQDIAPGTAWGHLPQGWKCPECGVGKDKFLEIPEQTAPDKPLPGDPVSKLKKETPFGEPPTKSI